MATNSVNSRFYISMGFLLILLSILGFTPFVYERFASGGHMSPALAVHAVAFFSWLCLFCYQASQVRARNLKRHMALGKASVLLAAVMVVGSLVVTNDIFDQRSSSATPFSPEQFIMLPLMDIALFAAYYGLAFRARKTPDVHKRLMLLAGIMMMDPATGRLGLALGFPPIGLLFHFGLIVALCVYDRRSLGHIHKVSWIAGLVLAARYVAFFTVGPTEGWAAFSHWLLG